jgi:hypothetical protein
VQEYLLLRSQKNEVFKCVQEAGLSPLDFEWGEEGTEYAGRYDYPVSYLEHLGSHFWFKFDRTFSGDYICRYSPGNLKLQEHCDPKAYWTVALQDFVRWLSYLKREIAPDLWEQLKEYAPDETFIGTAEISNAPFSYPEVENIIESVDRLRAQIEKNFDLRPDQLTFVKREFEYLKEAAKSQGRKAWMHTAIGVIMTIAVGLALSPEKTKLLWALLKSCFGGILQLPAP